MCLYMWEFVSVCQSASHSLTHSFSQFICVFLWCISFLFAHLWRLCTVYKIIYLFALTLYCVRLLTRSLAHSLARSLATKREKKAFLHFIIVKCIVYRQVDAVEYRTYVISFVHQFIVKACENISGQYRILITTVWVRACCVERRWCCFFFSPHIHMCIFARFTCAMWVW